MVVLNEHPFLNGIVVAYQDHRPFTLSPDMLWVLISQGFARHVALNYRNLQNKLVGFKEKKTIKVNGTKYNTMPGDTSSKWEMIFPEFNAEIKKFTGKKLGNILTSNFSTTNATNKIVSQITIMETFKNYFDYKVMFVGCGLPYVTLEGMLDDWKELKKKTEYLSKYELKWWTKELIPILDNLILAKSGKTNTTFWKNAIKVKTVKAPYGPFDNVDGWITRFFPYNKEGEKRKEWVIYTSNALASEIVKVPFILEDKETGKQLNMEFWAGFIGLTQDSANYSLKPELAWAVNNLSTQELKERLEKQRIDSLLSKINKTNIKSNQKERLTLEDMLRGKVNLGLSSGATLVLKNIDEIPANVYEKKHYSMLELRFRHKVNMNNLLATIQIDQLIVYGKISKKQSLELQNLFPKTLIYINQTPTDTPKII